MTLLKSLSEWAEYNFQPEMNFQMGSYFLGAHSSVKGKINTRVKLNVL